MWGAQPAGIEYMYIFFQGTVTLSKKNGPESVESVRCTLWAPTVEF